MLAGRYRLSRLLASGGMAQVWEAHDRTLGRDVAVKMLHPHLAEDAVFVERFHQEGVAAGGLGHPSIVAVFDVCSDDDREAIVMELVRGQSLRQYLNRVPTADPATIMPWGRQIAEALDRAHRAGIIHRDIKPANILIADDTLVKLTDFGIAKASASADLTEAGMMMGTAKYLAPEQVAGDEVDGRADLYSLGVVLYEALCGRVPFLADSDTATALQRLQHDPIAPRRLRPQLHPSVEAVLLRLLARFPEDRYASALEAADALAQCDTRLGATHPTGENEPVIVLGTADGAGPNASLVGAAGLAPPPAAPPPLPRTSATNAPPASPTPTPHKRPERPASPTPTATRSAAGPAAGTRGGRPAPEPQPAPAPAPAAAEDDLVVIDDEAVGEFRDPMQIAGYVVVAAVVLLSLGVAGALFGRSAAGGSLADQIGDLFGDDSDSAGDDGSSNDRPGAVQLPITSAATFDPPPGDGKEIDRQVNNAFDEDPNSYWRTERYTGGVGLGTTGKPGVGLILDLGEPAALERIEIDSTRPGWDVEIYLADEVGATLASWGERVGERSEVRASDRIGLDDTEARYVLVWITELSDTPSEDGRFLAEISEVRVYG